MYPAIWVAVIGGLFSVATIFYKQWSEARNINTAILAELQRLTIVLERHKEWWQERAAAGDTEFPLIPFATPVFDEHEQDIGQIDSGIIVKVVQFYGDVKFINSLQERRGEFHGEKSKDFDHQYLRILNGVCKKYSGQFDYTFKCYGLEASSESRQN